MRILQGSGFAIHQTTVPREECGDFVCRIVEREGGTIFGYTAIMDWEAGQASEFIILYRMPTAAGAQTAQQAQQQEGMTGAAAAEIR